MAGYSVCRVVKSKIIKIISDDTIYPNYKGWVGQQFVKSLLYKLNLCRFYVCLDSDVYFFKDFYIKDLHWPAFNLADTVIFIGAGLFLFNQFFTSESSYYEK